MNIHLPSVRTVVYTTDNDKSGRQDRIMKMMDQLQFKNWSFVYGSTSKSPYWKNIHVDFIKLLNGLDEPLLLIEDDAVATEFYKEAVWYPDDAGLIYLGGSAGGIDKPYHLKYCEKKSINVISSDKCSMIFSEYDDDYIIPYNMYTTHAILFINGRINEYLAKRIKWAKEAYAVDVVFALMMKKFKTYCLKHPMWYQEEKYEKTKLYYSNYSHSSPLIKSL